MLRSDWLGPQVALITTNKGIPIMLAFLSSQVYILSLSSCVIDRHVTARCSRSQNFANTQWAACLKPVNGKCPQNFRKLDYPGTRNLCVEYDTVCCLLTPVINL